MQNRILRHYLEFSQYTNPGLYRGELVKLSNKINEIGLLVRKSLIHRVVLKHGNTGSNIDLKYGDMMKVPWWRQCEDDIFPTVSAILAELFRRDNRGFILDRKEEDKLILTCRFVSILMASILKSKRIPCRVRAGFASYFKVAGGKSTDHWIIQYWNETENRWITIDVDGSLEDYLKFNPYDIVAGVFDFSADIWLAVRTGKIAGKHFRDTVGFEGLVTIGWELFHDFHCLMNNEIIYQYGPRYAWSRMHKLTEKELREIDELAELMQDPDENFNELKKIWQAKKKFRILKGGLL